MTTNVSMQTHKIKKNIKEENLSGQFLNDTFNVLLIYMEY